MAVPGTPKPKKAPNAVGELRRSAAASTFGPGAVADFRTSSGAPISGVIKGLDEWIRRWPDWPERVQDPRLEKILGVTHFKLPPIALDKHPDRALPAVRFPTWLQCPKCELISPADDWSSDVGYADRWCAACSRGTARKNRTYVIPVRFVMACEDGHLDDFPWDRWIEHDAGCTGRRAKHLRLSSVGAGLAGLRLTCLKCNASRSMESAFDRGVMKARKCTGRRPWLDGRNETCERAPRTLQRGASNLYFPVVETSLLIPPWTDDFVARFGDSYWSDLIEIRDPSQRFDFIMKKLADGKLDVPSDWDPATFARRAMDRASTIDQVDTTNLRTEEWRRLTGGELPGEESSEFEIVTEAVPDVVRGPVASIVRVKRLRELRALKGFTRINPPPGPGEVSSVRLSSLSRGNQKWLPAIEVRGEGIVVALDSTRVAAWELRQEVSRRVKRANDAYIAEHQERFGDDTSPGRELTGRHILAHSLAHAVIRELSLECGYSTASLRERLYTSDEYCGFLIYTATTDADGTLGGLQRQGEAARIGTLLRSAVRAQRWCSSDPLCISGAMSASNPTSGAACHSCMLAPETSCEEFNRFLDRAFLVGLPGLPGVGFFEEWLE